MRDVEFLTAQAIDFLREHEPPEGYFLAFSGGKDSVVIERLAWMAQVKYQSFYSATGIDPPELMQFIKKQHPEVKWLRPKYSFWEGIKKKYPPFRVSRWCCDVLKKDPIKKIGMRHHILGLRAEESFKRAQRPEIDNYDSKQTLYKPIFYWLEWHIWEFIERYKVPYCTLYDEGFDRLGCIVCPFITGRKVEIRRNSWPKMYKVFEHAVRAWFKPEIVGRSPMLQRFDIKTAEDFLQFWYGLK